jgi:hypothetical protein
MNSYAIHANPKTKSDLAYLIQSRHFGRENSAHGYQIVKELWGEEAAQDKTYNSRYLRSLRVMIEEAINDGALICSDSTAGYWWASSTKDVEAAERNVKRALTQKQNAEQLIKNIKKVYGGQLGLL